jgi:prolyl oligopeptidase
MAGVAITQRPDLWRAVVCRVPILDLIGACRTPYGRFVAEREYGDPDDPGEVRRIARFSPCQSVEAGTQFPSVYIEAGENDPRCPPWHARKFAALLQHAQSGEDPILLRVWRNAGHGGATPRKIQIDEQAEWIAFLAKELGLCRSAA